jgi:hypothetical protein
MSIIFCLRKALTFQSLGPPPIQLRARPNILGQDVALQAVRDFHEKIGCNCFVVGALLLSPGSTEGISCGNAIFDSRQKAKYSQRAFVV